MGHCEAPHCFAMLPVLIISPHRQAAARADWMPIQQKLQKISMIHVKTFKRFVKIYYLCTFKTCAHRDL